MEKNPELSLAWQFIENTGTHLFLTGKAGTGKTTFLRTLKQRSPKRMVVVAPTGIAAINAGGVTIHSFFQLPLSPFVPNTTFKSGQVHYRFGKEKQNIIRTMDLLVIDEISMVRADLLDAIDDVLRRYRDREKPFGGVQLLMIGDLQQLAPVVIDREWELLKDYYDSPYFFSSSALKKTDYMTIELKTVYRQQDEYFLSLLNKVRTNNANAAVLEELNKRYIPNFRPSKEQNYIRLTTHNHQAQRVNDRELSSLLTPAFRFTAEVSGNFPEYSFPTDSVLVLKEGAQIMFVKNDSSYEKRYYNGMIGEVMKVSENGIFVRNKADNHAFLLDREEWTNSKYILNSLTKEITEQVEGTFTQYPIRLAWAITIHKSQGLTFEHAIIDAQNSFAHGQTYVALSRCKTLEGMVLDSPLRSEAIISDDKVDEFNRQSELNAPDNMELHKLEKTYSLHLLHELFNFKAIEQAYNRMLRLLDEYFYKKYPDLLIDYKSLHPELQKIIQVSVRFEEQYTRLLSEANDELVNEGVQERIHSAAIYFRDQLVNFVALYSKTQIVTDNKELQKRAKERYLDLGDALSFKSRMLNYEGGEDVLFSVSDYLKNKARILLGLQEDDEKPTRKKKAKKEPKEKKPKVDTKKLTYEMFCQGMSIEEIAKERGFVPSTIVGHLVPYIIEGTIDATQLISQAKIDEVNQFIKTHPEKAESLLAIKDNVNNSISYSDIKLAMAALGLSFYH